MPYDFPSDIAQRVGRQIASGLYSDEDDLLRDAIDALEHQQRDLVAIQAGIKDMEAGRHRPFSEIDAEIRQKFGFQQEA